jgi:hypothetical protein
LTIAGKSGADELEDEDDFEDVDIFGEKGIIAESMRDGWVCVCIGVGSEKTRYLQGYAVAINNKGESKYIDLSDIYTIAAPLGNKITEAEY